MAFARKMRHHGLTSRTANNGQMLQKNKYPQMAIFQTGVALSMADSLEKGAIYAFQSCETYWDDELDGFPPLDDALLNIDK